MSRVFDMVFYFYFFYFLFLILFPLFPIPSVTCLSGLWGQVKNVDFPSIPLSMLLLLHQAADASAASADHGPATSHL